MSKSDDNTIHFKRSGLDALHLQIVVTHSGKYTLNIFVPIDRILAAIKCESGEIPEFAGWNAVIPMDSEDYRMLEEARSK